MKKQNGITLIALIITIVVLLILAVVTIKAVRDGGIIQHAQNAASDYTIAQEKEQIGLGYSEYLINKNISENADLKVEGASVIGNETDGWIITFSKTGNEYTLSKNGVVEEFIPVEPIVHGDIIPQGGVYKRVAEDGTETQYVAGQAFPETVLDGDIYIFEDYEYRYNCIWYENWLDITTANQALASEGISLSSGGWGVRVTDATKTEYTSMITTINGKDVTNLCCAYAVCTNLVSTPELSSKAKDMTFAFYTCTALTTVSNLPDSVTSLNSTFSNCHELTTISNLPDSVTNLANTFAQCYALTTVPAIPSSVTNMRRTFGCCSALEKAPDMSKATNITNMYGTFEECESLTGEIVINANPSEYEYCFSKTKITKITGTATNATKEALAKTGTNISWE